MIEQHLPTEQPSVDRDDQTWDLTALAATLEAKRKAIFLRTLSTTGNLLRSARAAGYQTTGPINRAMELDADFQKAVADAIRAAGDALESELIDRAMNGVEKDVYYKGEVCGQEVIKSDTLLLAAVRAAKKEKYADAKQIDHNHSGVIGVAVIPMTVASESDWERQSALAHDNQKSLTEPGQVIDVTPEVVSPAPMALKRG